MTCAVLCYQSSQPTYRRRILIQRTLLERWMKSYIIAQNATNWSNDGRRGCQPGCITAQCSKKQRFTRDGVVGGGVLYILISSSCKYRKLLFNRFRDAHLHRDSYKMRMMCHRSSQTQTQKKIPNTTSMVTHTQTKSQTPSVWSPIPKTKSQTPSVWIPYPEQMPNTISMVTHTQTKSQTPSVWSPIPRTNPKHHQYGDPYPDQISSTISIVTHTKNKSQTPSVW